MTFTTLEAAVECLAPQLRAFIRKRAAGGILDRESISDLAQSVWREALTIPGRTFVSEAQAIGFLFTIATRKLVERQRFHSRLRRDATRTVPIEEATSLPARESPREDTDDQMALLGQAIERLDVGQRLVIFLKYVAGMSHDEIAPVLGTTPGGARQHLHQAMKELRKLFLQSGGDPDAV